jgi:hypothetical protein
MDKYHFGTCAHIRAASMLIDEIASIKPFRAILNFNNRKGLHFTETKSFDTLEEAARWLETRAFVKFRPAGYVTDIFGELKYELTEEDIWREA